MQHRRILTIKEMDQLFPRILTAPDRKIAEENLCNIQVTLSHGLIRHYQLVECPSDSEWSEDDDFFAREK